MYERASSVKFVIYSCVPSLIRVFSLLCVLESLNNVYLTEGELSCIYCAFFECCVQIL